MDLAEKLNQWDFKLLVQFVTRNSCKFCIILEAICADASFLLSI
jgi:hypothetical protein